ncbi:PQQ-dependent dehydrogenase, methanol/ethanol family [Sphingomonas psychrotolerans]|uniref:PQQ-dependent dehydrogenase, methanol/ethanol family n=1 Tax=Sphingomonas psychrotolerans TaxID=1327635 RepID=A0ABU3N6S6_9SPHN|nr:PQQ-dependent dehydrogenase, methanol/ethanol family [Sphingomonas psychrotolerans]MDT8760173.1 PQQ-dependent dehydrogenase, methanol/ethanol family [Sphingomonas psychrotolerans]
MKLNFWRVALALGCASFAVQGLAQSRRKSADVDHARLRAADRAPGEWMAPGRTYDEQRFSPLDAINDRNVTQLGLAWFADLPVDRGVEASPLMIGGVLYNIEPWNVTVAYDAKTGRELWRFDPKVDRDKGKLACCDIVTRGLAAWQGRIILATLDGRLIALDAKTGNPAWSVNTLEPVWPYTITGAPRVFDGKVLIGNAGAEGAARGYVTAYDAATGKQLWRFYTVPGDPAKPQPNKILEMAARTWNSEWWKVGGGGTVWDSIVYDPDLDLVYIGTGNGGPWAQRYRSPGGGDNLFLSSIVALNAKTGDYVWHYQTTPGDEWDYTATQSMILADLTIDGKLRKVLMQAPKNGFFYVLDRATGKLISAKPFVPMNWANGIDMATGRPNVNPEARYSETPVLLTPGPGGGHNWNPMAYSPRTRLAYFPVTEMYMAYSVNPNFRQSPGNMSQLGISTTGYDLTRKAAAAFAAANNKAWLTAWDPVKQEERWRVPYSNRGSGGVLATAGNLVFEGTVNGTFAAYRADTGTKLWEMPVQQLPIAAPIAYSIDGQQYIAVNAGWGGGLAHSSTAKALGFPISTPRLLVFRLGGKVQLPELAEAGSELVRPADTGAPDAIARGEELYAQNCMTCHGERARGGIKDLRRMSPETHKQFLDIVLRGARREKGMASFGDVLSTADAQAIQAYLARRANEDWADLLKGE